MTLDPHADRPPRPWYLAAALVVVLLAAVAGASFVGWAYWRQQPDYANTYSTNRGAQLDVALPDGTQMTLDASTRIEVSLYPTRRVVRLSTGQVVFRVPEDGRPFEVQAGPLRIEAAGARVAVRHTPKVDKDPRGHVAVEAGRVQVRLGDTVADLNAGEQVASDGTGRLGPVAPMAPEAIATWRLGRVAFDATPLVEVLAEFERYGPTGLVPADPQVGAMPVTGSFDPRRPEDFRRVLPG
ncbi:MAG: FecR domain-containing protein, partial [Rhizobacter sp.]